MFFFIRHEYMGIAIWATWSGMTCLVTGLVVWNSVAFIYVIQTGLAAFAGGAVLAALGYSNEKQRRKKYLLMQQLMEEKDTTHMNFIDHQMKQKFAGGSMLVEQLMEMIEEADDSELASGRVEYVEIMKQLKWELLRGKELCYQLTMQRQLVGGTYVPKPTRLELEEVCKSWCGNLCELTYHSTCPAEVMLDWNLYQHILDNARSNAIKYGGATWPLMLHVRVEAGDLALELMNPPGPDQEHRIKGQYDFQAIMRESTRPGDLKEQARFRTVEHSNSIGLSIAQTCAQACGARWCAEAQTNPAKPAPSPAADRGTVGTGVVAQNAVAEVHPNSIPLLACL
mmetsp:Transcript_58195/g.185377  ORF Transcript_58195/g.185377 Transcript_58195/m.185377 type:complete len:340 (+) Transcript_58195:1220-2239(+)